MAKNITLMGANYPDVPAVKLPQTGGGEAMFVDADEIGDVENALAIVVDGNNAPKAITSGQYLFIKNNSTLATGGYHAIGAISQGATISSTSNNVSPDTEGISNSLKATISALSNLVSVVSLQNLSSYTANTLIQATANNGILISVISCTGGNRLSDLPIIQAGTYIIIPGTTYIKLIFLGTNGAVYFYDGTNWIQAL